ncbi:dynein axonemal heavy chain 10 [Phymastichus coffea]|uniref:dynein axonemal heavy chain 10 n=1 Tax=Phymastichus coffea TaxID=108790 RepID=UPI00273C9604|nr:dynein axonemal heavy chain 10 [Phymastichus coffea]
MSEWQEFEKASTTDSFLEYEVPGSKSETSFAAQPFFSGDYRIDWIREKVLSFLDLGDDSRNLFDNLIYNDIYRKKLVEFLNSDTYGEEVADLKKKQVFFYKTFRDEIVQEEVAVWEEDKRKKQGKPAAGKKIAEKKAKKIIGGKGKSNGDDPSAKSDEAIVSDNAAESSTALQSTSAAGASDTEEGDEQFADNEYGEKLSDEASELTMKDQNEPAASFVPPAGEEDNYILTRKVVDRTVRIPVLHCLFGEMDHDSRNDEQRLIYFVRISDSAFPDFETRAECWAEMPRYVIAGSLLRGKYLFAMDQILQQVFLPLVKKEFRGPEAARDKALRNSLTWMTETPGMERAAATLCNLLKSQGTAFVAPSSMRQVSLLTERAASESRTGSRDRDVEPSVKELTEYLTNLIESVAWTIDHMEAAEASLYIPDTIVPESTDSSDAMYIGHLEELVMSWEKRIRKVLESSLSKTPEANHQGPLAELTYWHEREHSLSVLVEQLHSAAVMRVLDVLNSGHSAVATGFAYFARELNNGYAEAKENNKFLSTVLRQFKIVATSDSFQVISNIIPSIYEHLRMIWVLSKYYSTEERMVTLLERISWQLKQTVIKNLAIRDLFENSVEQILEKTISAHEMLKLWKEAYLSTRLNIELSGKGARWEFDQQRLFKETDYLALVSANLHEVASVLRDFYNIFGEELKSIVDDPARIDSIIERVTQLLGPIRNAEVDAFNEYNRESWEATMSWFRAEVARLEIEAKIFIDECFASLINAEDALTMLIKFRNMQTRDAVHERLSMKFDLIMQQFGREIDEVEELFHKGKANPPLLRDHLPVAGAIYWERNLFHRLDGSVKTFKQVAELDNSELKVYISEQYAAVAKQTKQFENIHFTRFIAEAQRTLQNVMKKSILALRSHENAVDSKTRRTQKKFPKMSMLKGDVDSGSTLSRPISVANQRDEGRLNPSINHKSPIDSKKSMSFSIKTDTTSKSMTIQAKFQGKSDQVKSIKSKTSCVTDSTELACAAMLLQNRTELFVNFDNEIFDIIHESELLEHLGFTLPVFIREVGIQKNRLHVDCRAVKKMINQYNEMIGNLDDPTMKLLRQRLDTVQKHIQPGLTRLNWYSLGVANYADTCSKLLENLSSIVRQIKQTRLDLDSHISQELGCCNLFATSDDLYELQSCKDFFSDLEKKRTQSIGRMLKCYQSINPMLVKLETLVEATTSGKSLAMALHYQYYEQKVFTTLTACFLKNLQHLKQLLLTNEPLFYVDAALFASEAVLKPSVGDIYTIILRDVKDLMERLKIFPRWMSGTCLESCSNSLQQSDAMTTFSFFEDVMGVQGINDLIFALQDAGHKLSHDCWRYLYKWKHYSNLWSLDKTLVCEKFVAANPTLQQYDEKFTFYDSIISELDDIDNYYDIFSIRINLCQLLEEIKRHAREWKQVLANFLLTQMTQAMNELKNNIEQLKNNIELVINGLERFKLVMQCISQIKSSAIGVEVEYSKFQETFRILRFHKVEFSVEEEKIAYRLQQDWESLYLSALYRSTSLESTKDQFCDMTRCEINDFERDIAQFVDKFLADGPGSCGDDLDAGLEKMEEYGEQINELSQKLQDLTNAELLFDLPPADYSSFHAAKRDYEAMVELFQLYKAQQIARDTWAKTLWADLNPQQLIDGMDNYLKELRKMPKATRNLNVGRALETSMKNFKNSVPLFVELKNEAMRERHWKELMERTGKHFDMTPSRFTLENMFTMNLTHYQDIAESIVNNASRELAIERGVQEVAQTWSNMTLKLMNHSRGNEDRGFIFGSVDELYQILEDNTLNLQSMSASQFIGPFLNVVQKWEKALRTIADVVEAWLELQKRWMYLEGIFMGGDIRSQLPDEAKRFDDVDMNFRRIMADCAKRPNVLECCTVPNRKEEIEALIMALERCQKSLTEYLKNKRSVFPRFCFISDDELLSILGGSNAYVIQDHVGKMFDNLAKFRLTVDNQERLVANALISSEGETMEFRNAVVAIGNIENWMVLALDEMKYSNRYLTKKAVLEYGAVNKSRTEWMLDFQGMMILAANQIWWTAEVENVFKQISSGQKQAMKNYLQQLNRQLDQVVQLMGESSLSNNDRKKFDTVLTIDVHTRDIIESFVRDSIMDALEFEWESQLRFYWIHDLDNVWINQCTGSFEYGYEYMGLNGRLVVTPLTDRIYLTITQALSMYMGGAPAGPAGTGKTETTKDLAKALGLLCVVTNCGEGMDYVAIGKTLGGLAQCGAWGCFDEFNRIDVSVLSVISTQLQAIKSALQNGASRFTFENQDIKLDSKIGIFITMNPGYAGRTELPESVKAFFRPVVCIVPDNELICQIKLFSAGFLTAKVLAKKMTVLYHLAREQLSKQNHYDFGLRALRSVLNMAGQLKRSCSPDLPENVVLMRALRDMNLPKFIFEDVPLFLGLIKDLFPGIDCPRIRYPDFNDAVEKALFNKNLIIIPEQVDKIVQLYEVMMTRHSTMVVGPTGGGKTTVIQALCDAQTLLGTPTKLAILNPKACSVIELYGVLDNSTRDWTDGLLSNIFREINKPLDTTADKLEKKYILFDGDVDALWIENMNSVMDDNKLLTLANQERIRLQDHCNLLFEVGDLQYASPATVSRAGMVYVDPKNLGYQPYMDKWINSRLRSERQMLRALCDKYVHSALKLIIDGMLGLQHVSPLQMIIPQTSLNMVVQLCCTINALYPKPATDEFMLEEGQAFSSDEQEAEFNEKVLARDEILEAVYLEACYCSLGASLTLESRSSFDEFMKKTSGFMMIEDSREKPAGNRYIPTLFPQLYDYFLDLNGDKCCCWIPWRWKVNEYKHARETNFWEILVPTVDTVRATWYVKLMTESRKPLILVGDTGTSKSAIVMDFLRNVDPVKFNYLPINFSSRTTSLDVQRNIESVIEKRTKEIYGPPPGKRLIVFIDDMNMPVVDTYGTQQPIALLKLLLERNGFYDRGKDLNWKTIRDTNFLAAMGRSGGGRHNVDPRFISMFSVYNVTFPAEDTLHYIYESILTGHLEVFAESVQMMANTIVKLSLHLYKIIITELPPTPSKFHYIFNMRDLSRVMAGLLQSDASHFKSSQQFVRLWRNEFTRIFYDRLISESDRQVVEKHIESGIKNSWEEEISSYSLRNPLLFGDFRNACNIEGETRFYEDLLDYEAVFNLFMEILEEYNEHRGKLSVVLFNDALEHLTRVHRILRLQRGHALVVGVGGSGRRSTIRLASFAADCEIFEISLSRGYDESSFREDVKKVLTTVGVDNLKTVFLLTDEQVVEESFLEVVNNLMTSGVISALFSDDEKDAIVASCRNAAKEANYGVTKENVWSYFAKRGTDNLRVALSMSPAGDILRSRCRSYPGLVNCTTIDWIFPWPEQALLAVASVTLRDNNDIPEAHRDAVVQHAVHAHTSMSRYTSDYLAKLRRPNYVTPRHYLDALEIYIDLLTEQRAYIESQCSRLSGGLTKIAEASENLDRLNAILAVQQTKVDAQTTNCETLLTTIGENTSVAQSKKALGEEKRREIEERNKVIAKESAEAREALAQAQPGLESARRALEDLDKSDITEIRSFATPPEPVQVVCECVAIIRGLKEISWKSAKGMMSDPNFLRILQETNCDEISLKQQQMVRAHLKKSNKMEQMKTISTAGYGLYKFVLAVLDYCSVFREVKPKIDRVRELEVESERARKALEREERDLTKVEKQLVELNAKYETATAERQSLEEETQLLQRRLVAADKLISGLSSENERWQRELNVLELETEKIVGNCLLSAEFLAYSGPFTFEFRAEMLYQDWLRSIVDLGVPISQPFKIDSQLTNDVEISGWSSQGLPPDELSVQNAILTVRASRFPLCIDPQQQALKWIKKREEKANLKVLTFSDKDFAKQVEIAIKYGFAVIFQDVDYVDPILDNVVMKNVTTSAGRSFVMLGDKEVDYDPRFRMYLMTKHSNPAFNPAIYAKVCVINYMVTTSGLEAQLLSVVVGFERPDIEDQREALISETSALKALLQQLEDSLLREISSNQGNMLDNIDLIETLENAKTSAHEVSSKLDAAMLTSRQIDRLREDYRTAAKRGAILFFVLANMSLVSNMYQYSLGSYLEVFVRSLKRAQPDPMLPRRLANVVKTLTQSVYDYGCTGLFERHKLLFSFQICTRIELQTDHSGKLDQAHLDFFVKGNVSLERSSRPNPADDWLAAAGWEDLLKLAADFPDKFADLPGHLEARCDQWKQWFDLDAPEVAVPPYEADSQGRQLLPFERLMLLRCFRVDRVYRAVVNYISQTMGQEFITPPSVGLETIYKQSTSSMPIIFVLSPGSDPTSELMKLAERHGFGAGKFRYLSLGQGQEPVALDLLENAVARGQWLMLQNCHLLLKFTSELEKSLDILGRPHAEFRLWLTTDPNPNFPIGILQQCFKVVMEPPNGLKLNLKNTYFKMNDQTLDNCEHRAYKDIVYVLAFYHAVLQERRKYDKIGWNINYDFNESDFNVCTTILATYLTKNLKLKESRIPWNSLKYLIGEVIYGGRVIDNYDRRVSKVYVDEYFGDFLFDAFQPFHFHRDDQVDYFIPPTGGAADRSIYLQFIEELPLVNSPEVFGLHPNAEISYFTQVTKEMWGHLIELQPQTGENTFIIGLTGGAGLLSRDQFIDNVAREILQKMPPEYDMVKIKRNFGLSVSPSTIVLFQELERFNKLISKMTMTLQQLRKAIAGEIGMDYTLENVGNSLYNGTLPKEWARLAPDTRKRLASWMEHFEKRISQYTSWSGCNEPVVVWLSGLHNPETYLAALVQMACRKNNWPLDRSVIYTAVSPFGKAEQVEERPEEGCYVQGLFLEGARWDLQENCLKRSYPKVLIEELPIFKIIPIEAHRLKLLNTIKVPVYTTCNRRNAMGVGLVFEADLITKEHPSHWILQGVSLTLNTD